VLALSRHDRASVDALGAWLRSLLAAHRAGSHVAQDPGPMAPHSHSHPHPHDHDHPYPHDHVPAVAASGRGGA
jgi:urease accessory protein